MKVCIYCAVEKPDDEFSDEHIWPDALGGDHLSSLWRTDDVCMRCNNLSGLFVDGSFIKSWLGAAERSTGAREYLGTHLGTAAVLPLDYIGVLPNVPMGQGEIAEYWCGPCGAIIIHIRPEDTNEQWKPYAGGDPRAKKAKAGRAYLALTSEEPFWILVSLASFKAHFKRSRRFVVNMEIPPQWQGSFEPIDKNDPTQMRHMEVVSMVTSAGRNDDWVPARATLQADVGDRLLAKVALAIGYKLLGLPFLATDHAQNLRKGFREADPEKRRSVPVAGSGYINAHPLGEVAGMLSWPGGWVLLLNANDGLLFLTVVSPSGRPMTVLVCDQPIMVADLGSDYQEGCLWLTIPSLGEAAGPIPLGSYLAHKLNRKPLAELKAIEDKRVDSILLPLC